MSSARMHLQHILPCNLDGVLSRMDHGHRFATDRAVKPRTTALPAFNNAMDTMDENFDPTLRSFDSFAPLPQRNSKARGQFESSINSHPLSQACSMPFFVIACSSISFLPWS